MDHFRPTHFKCSSYEGFPNVKLRPWLVVHHVLQRMLVNSALIVGKTGWIVPPKNPNKLSKAIEKALSEIGSKN